MDHLMAGYHTPLLVADGHIAGISFYDRAPFDCDQSIVAAFWITPEIAARRRLTVGSHEVVDDVDNNIVLGANVGLDDGP